VYAYVHVHVHLYGYEIFFNKITQSHKLTHILIHAHTHIHTNCAPYLVFEVPVPDPTHEGRDKGCLGICACHRLAKGEEKGHVDVNALYSHMRVYEYVSPCVYECMCV
jgi:hypothetical protein